MHLFQPLTLSAITLPNRAVVALDVHGGADDVVAADHAQKAGAGLILTPPLDVERAEIQPWCGVVQAVHDAGGRIAARLSQGGAIARSGRYPGAGRRLCGRRFSGPRRRV
jgi:2,4-dienoyl-CoA reductase-like NADH-dependent reductase (Old Yellow Enzyme family)